MVIVALHTYFWAKTTKAGATLVVYHTYNYNPLQLASLFVKSEAY